MSDDPVLLTNIRYNVLFESASEETLQKVLKGASLIDVPEGDVIFEDESTGGCLYLILAGSVKIAKTTKRGDEAILAILHSGDFFGELELIDGRPRSARAIAIADCKIAVLYQPQFDDIIQSDRGFVLNLIRMMSMRLRTSD